MHRQLLTTLFLLSTCLLSAQTASLTGRVLDADALPLPGATLLVDDEARGVTDQDGRYRLQNLPAGERTVTVTYIGFTDAATSVTLEDGVTTDLDFTLQAGVELAAITVISPLRGQARAFNQQLTRMNVTNIIAADQIGRFPDANLGDALKRVPGVNVQYDQGEARFGNIRGTSPQLNSVTVNGERIPSAEAEVRSIQLDLIPADMVQAIEVNKAVTPDMDADAIGGSVNIVTRAAPAGRRISGTLGAGYNALVDKPSLNASIVAGDRFLDDKLGVILSGSYFDNRLGSDNVEAEWVFEDANDNGRLDADETASPEEIQIRQYYLQRIRQSYSLSLDYRLTSDHTFTFRGLFNDRKDWENRYRAVFSDIATEDGVTTAELERQTKGGNNDTKQRRLEDQKMMSFNLGGEHAFGLLSAKWSATYSRASEDRPNERYFEYATDGAVPVELDLSDTRTPRVVPTEAAFRDPSAAWAFSELTEEFQFTTDEDLNARLDLKLPLRLSGDYRNELQFGLRLRDKDKVRTNDFYEYEPTSGNTFTTSLDNLQDESKDDYLAGDYRAGRFVSEDYLADLDLTGPDFKGERDLSELAGNFNAEETITAAYVSLDQQLGKNLKALVGLRLERTDLSYAGFRYDDEAETLTATPREERDYLNVLPGLHLRYQLRPRTVARFAFTNTLARPNYFDLVPYREIEDGEELSIGNPGIEPTTSTNFDLSLEHYFGTVGLVSAAVFYKDITDFIVNRQLSNFTFEGTEWADFTQPVNGGQARLLGVEVAYQRNLDFIAKALTPLSLYLNYTYLDSKVTDFDFEGREDDDLRLPGSPDHSLNASIAYDGGRFTTRLSFNYAADFIQEVGETAFTDIYYDAVTYLDFNFNVSLTERFTLYGNANNLLNQPLRFYQGRKELTFQQEFYASRFDLGLKYDLFER